MNSSRTRSRIRHGKAQNSYLLPALQTDTDCSCLCTRGTNSDELPDRHLHRARKNLTCWFPTRLSAAHSQNKSSAGRTRVGCTSEFLPLSPLAASWLMERSGFSSGLSLGFVPIPVSVEPGLYPPAKRQVITLT